MFIRRAHVACEEVILTRCVIENSSATSRSAFRTPADGTAQPKETWQRSKPIRRLISSAEKRCVGATELALMLRCASRQHGPQGLRP